MPVDVSEHRYTVRCEDWPHRQVPGIGWRDHLIAWPDADGKGGSLKRARAVALCQGIVNVVVARELALELVHDR